MPHLRCLVALLLGLLPLAVKPALAQIAASDTKSQGQRALWVVLAD